MGNCQNSELRESIVEADGVQDMEHHRIIIIGGGIAGIGCASVLSKNGVNNYRVLEYSNRIGGRLRPFQLTPEISVNLGANWIMGERNPLLKILKDSGNSETLLDPEYFSDEKKVIVLDEKYENITEKMEVYHKQFLNDWHEMTQYFQQTEELISIEEFMKRTDSSPEKIPRDIYEALHYIHGYSQICASEPATCSIGDADEKQMEERFGETPIATSNISACVAEIAKDVPNENIIFNSDVFLVTNDNNKFHLSLRNSKGSVEQMICDFLVSAVPISQYQSKRLRLEFMTPEKDELISALSLVHFANCFVLLEKDQEHLLPDKNDFIYLPNNEENIFRSIEFDPMILRFHGRKAIAFRTTSEKAKKFNSLSRDEIKKNIQTTIKRVFGFDANIENFSNPTWAAQENFQGCYTNVALCPGKTFDEFYSRLNVPLVDNFYMIGEAFDGSNAGYAHGAYLTGVNSAEQILKLLKTEDNKER